MISGDTIRAYERHRNMVRKKAVCHAPFTNMYFGHGGKVMACCYNRTYLLGKYPQQTLKDIWLGERTSELKMRLQKYDFSAGCINCENQLAAHNFAAFKGAGFDHLKISDSGYPSSLQFELDNYCNLECVMCTPAFSSSIGKRLGIERKVSPYGKEFLNELESFYPYLTHAEFYGGEPFLIPVYTDIWERLVSVNPDVTITVQTNATSLNSRVKELLQRGKFSINISLDSLQKTIYETIRVNASFEQVMENVRFLIELSKVKGIPLFISACIMQLNYKEAIDLVAFCNSHSVKLYFHTVFQPKSLSMMTMPKDKLKGAIEFLKGHSFPETEMIEKHNANAYKGLLNQLEYWLNTNVNTSQRKDGGFANTNDFWQWYDGMAAIDGNHNFKNNLQQLFKELGEERTAMLLANTTAKEFADTLPTLIQMEYDDLADLVWYNLNS